MEKGPGWEITVAKFCTEAAVQLQYMFGVQFMNNLDRISAFLVKL